MQSARGKRLLNEGKDIIEVVGHPSKSPTATGILVGTFVWREIYMHVTRPMQSDASKRVAFRKRLVTLPSPRVSGFCGGSPCMDRLTSPTTEHR